MMALIFQLPERLMTRDDKIKQIAKKHFGVSDFTVQNRDSLDFHDVHVDSMRRALEEAYEAGTRASDTLLRRQLGLTK